ncbi:MAG: hypothetical protein ACLTW9_15715 [Enterocloster sp.]
MKLPETYTDLRKQTLEQEGMKYPGKALVAMELEPGYERAKNRMLPYIQAINEAHLIMLMEQGIVDEKMEMSFSRLWEIWIRNFIKIRCMMGGMKTCIFIWKAG